MSEQGPAPVKRGFDLTVNLGHVIIIVGIATGMVGSYYVTGFRLDEATRKIEKIDAKIDGFSKLLIDAAVAEQRMKDIERRLAIAEHR